MPPRAVPAALERYGSRDDVGAFADTLSDAHGLPLGWVKKHLAEARYVPQVARLMMPPTTPGARDWTAYRSRFLEAKRVTAGADFWRAHRAWLDEAERRYGVPPSLVVGILGVETYYGRITGNFRVIDALSTLAFDFPTGRRDRTPFFRTQLQEYLLWCHREGRDPSATLGSFAGAIGLPQFMPGSINKFAVDFDGDGRIDLLNSPADVVGSVARYMAEHGWRRDVPTHFEVEPPRSGAEKVTLLEPDIKPSFSATRMAELGARFNDARALAHAGPMALVEMLNGTHSAPTYVAGTENFYAVTRYNQSSNYALAVVDLGEAIRSVVIDGLTPERAAKRNPSAWPGGAPTAATGSASGTATGTASSTPPPTVNARMRPLGRTAARAP
jgi:membrane-bound lytic murein transglycosylase B